MKELAASCYEKHFDGDTGKFYYINTVIGTLSYEKPAIFGDRDLPTPRSKRRGLKWSADYYRNRVDHDPIVHRKPLGLLTYSHVHVCGMDGCYEHEDLPNTFFECKRCNSEWYCSKAHMFMHSSLHKVDCNKVVSDMRHATRKGYEAVIPK